MAYTLKTNLADKQNYGGSRKISDIKYIAIHYTGNDGDTATANGNYFKNNVVKVSAHYFVDDSIVVRSVPDDYVAWSVGGSKYGDCDKNGGGKYYGKCTNANSLSVELCDTKKNGKYDFTEETLANGALLVKELMEKYKIPVENVIRHFDVNGKVCPKLFVESVKDWNSFTARLSAAVKADNMKASPQKEYKAKVTAAALNIRSDAAVSNKIVGVIKKDEVYTIVEEKNGWGKLKSGVGWISLSYVKKL